MAELMKKYYSSKDKSIVSELAKKYFEIANSEYNRKSIELAYNSNDLKGGRPFVSIDEIPWVEFSNEPDLKLCCDNSYARLIEDYFRKELYCFRYFPTNRIFRKYFAVRKSYDTEGWNVCEKADIIISEKGNGIVSHRYHDIFETEEDINKMKPYSIIPRHDLDYENIEKTNDLLDGILETKLVGEGYIYLAPWDQLVRMHTVENTFFDFYDRPQFMHSLMQRYVELNKDRIEQLEKFNLLDSCDTLSSLHCTAPYTEILPSTSDKKMFKMEDIWIRCTAQSLGSCSPEMYNNFEIEHMAPLFSRFGAVYYGCCEPLEKVIPYLKNHPNIRKIGVSPFANVYDCAEQIGRNYTLSRKPNPSYLSGGFSKEIIEKEIRQTVEICEKFNCSYDYVLKDISTIGHKPERLAIWAKTVNAVLDEFYGK